MSINKIVFVIAVISIYFAGGDKKKIETIEIPGKCTPFDETVTENLNIKVKYEKPKFFLLVKFRSCVWGISDNTVFVRYYLGFEYSYNGQNKSVDSDGFQSWNNLPADNSTQLNKSQAT